MDGTGESNADPLAAAFDPGSEAGRERVRLAIENFGIAFFETDCASGQVVVTPNAFAMFGLPVPARMPVDRSPFWDTYHPEDAGWARERYAADLRGERGRDSYCERVRIIRRDDDRIRWIEFSGRMFGPPGARTHIVGMLRDVSDEVEAAERQALLMREIDHRGANLLAVVGSLLRLTGGETVAAYRGAVEERIGALARAHSLLGRAAGTPTATAEVAEAELAAWRGHVDMALAGAPPLAPGSVQPVAMVLHELATNAAKHGALSAAAGRVRLAVACEGAEVVLRWSESGGPPVPGAPARQATGMAVIAAQARRLGGALAWRWAATGLEVELRVPVPRWAG